MALFNRIGNILKQSLSRHTNLELCASRTSLYQAIRSMSSTKLFVGGLSYDTDETSLREAFSQHGQVIEARVIFDRNTGRSRGFAFVTYTSTEEASSALSALDGQDLHGRLIRVNYATEKRPAGFGRGSGGGFNYGGTGSYASGNYGGGGNYGTNNSYPGGGGNYGGDVEQGSFGAGYGGGSSGNYNAGVSDSNDLFNNSEFGGSPGTSHNGGEEQLSADQGTESVNSDFTPGAEGSHRDDENDEPNDYANSRG